MEQMDVRAALLALKDTATNHETYKSALRAIIAQRDQLKYPVCIDTRRAIANLDDFDPFLLEILPHIDQRCTCGYEFMIMPSYPERAFQASHRAIRLQPNARYYFRYVGQADKEAALMSLQLIGDEDTLEAVVDPCPPPVCSTIVNQPGPSYMRNFSDVMARHNILAMNNYIAPGDPGNYCVPLCAVSRPVQLKEGMLVLLDQDIEVVDQAGNLQDNYVAGWILAGKAADGTPRLTIG